MTGSLNQIHKRTKDFLLGRGWSLDVNILTFENGHDYDDYQILIQIAPTEEKLKYRLLSKKVKYATETFFLEEKDWSYFENLVKALEQINDRQSTKPKCLNDRSLR